jgi:hypothetical protein
MSLVCSIPYASPTHCGRNFSLIATSNPCFLPPGMLSLLTNDLTGPLETTAAERTPSGRHAGNTKMRTRRAAPRSLPSCSAMAPRLVLRTAIARVLQ